MKLTLLCFSLIISQLIFAQSKNTNVKNGGFETWVTKEISEDPIIWETANRQTGMPIVTKISSTLSGNYAMRMETKIESEDTIFGFVIHGSPDDDDPEYIPYNDDADSLVGWYRYDIELNDSALMIVGFKTGAIVESATWVKVGGEQSTWKRFAYKLNPHVGTPDSMYIGFASSNAMDEATVKHGSWMELDDIHFVDAQGVKSDTIPNADFEHWRKVTVEEPEGWWSFNKQAAGLGLIPVTKDVNANSGQFAVKLETLKFEDFKQVNKEEDDNGVPGLVTNGEFIKDLNDTLPFIGIPYTERPKKFSGSYKVYPAKNDTGIIAIVFYKNHKVLDYKNIVLTDTVKEFTSFNFDLKLDEKPDTMLIVIFSGDEKGSKLIVDDLSFSDFISDVPQIKSGSTVLVYPNPSKDGMVNILMEGISNTPVDLEVFDLGGKRIMKIDGLDFYQGVNGQISSSLKMEKGIYFFRFRFNEKNHVQRVVIE